jgi:hypothetical protein
VLARLPHPRRHELEPESESPTSRLSVEFERLDLSNSTESLELGQVRLVDDAIRERHRTTLDSCPVARTPRSRSRTPS